MLAHVEEKKHCHHLKHAKRGQRSHWNKRNYMSKNKAVHLYLEAHSAQTRRHRLVQVARLKTQFKSLYFRIAGFENTLKSRCGVSPLGNEDHILV